MKIIYFGSDIFAVAPLERLLNSKEEICAVVTQTDKKMGRHLNLGQSAVKAFALKNKLKIIQPENLKDKTLLKELKEIKPDLFITAAYGKILPKEMLGIPKIFPLNIHASLLPKYRGAAPVNWAMLKGEKETGVTIIKMNELMDAGEIISQASLSIEEGDTAISLREKLSYLAAGLLLKTIESIKVNKFSLLAQNEAQASFAPKLKKSDGLIDWNSDSARIHNQVRGLLPWPGSFTYFRGKILKIHQTEILPQTETNTLPGQISQILPDAIVLCAGKGLVSIKSMQLESGKKLASQEFVSGYKIKIGEKLG